MIKKAAKTFKDNVSVSFTLISFLLIVGTGLLQVFGKVESTGPFMELFGTCCGLYWGRRGVDAFVNYQKEKAKKSEVTEEKSEEL